MARLGGHSSFGRHSEATLSLAYVGGFTLVIFLSSSISRFSPLVSPFILFFYPLCSLPRLLSSFLFHPPSSPFLLRPLTLTPLLTLLLVTFKTLSPFPFPASIYNPSPFPLSVPNPHSIHLHLHSPDLLPSSPFHCNSFSPELFLLNTHPLSVITLPLRYTLILYPSIPYPSLVPPDPLTHLPLPPSPLPTHPHLTWHRDPQNISGDYLPN